MDSKRNVRVAISALAAAVLTGAAVHFGKGLHPHWWLMWVAALPVLLVAPSLRWGWAFLVALAAFTSGYYISFWTYSRRDIQMPLATTLAYLLLPAAAFALAVLLFRAFFRRGQVWMAVLAFPSLIVANEYLSEQALGTYGNTAYTQLKNLPVLQLAAITGMWGIGFVVMLIAPALAAAILSPGATRRHLLLVSAGVLACVYGYGVWRLRATPRAPHTVVVGLASTQYGKYILPTTDARKLELLNGYAAQVKALAARGAKIVVLPEMSVLVAGSLSVETDRLMEKAAQAAQAQILLGVINVTSHAGYNEARLYSPEGTVEAVYRKRHLVPVLEGRTTPVKDMSVLNQPEGKLGLEICRDMDYPHPSRNYGANRVGLLLVPAWDQGVDRGWHGHMAIMRGVEYGYSIARSAKVGYLTVSDDRGRILAQASTAPQVQFTTLLADVPVRHDRTLYQSLGDWFAWVDLAVLCALILLALSPRRKPVSAEAHASAAVATRSADAD